MTTQPTSILTPEQAAEQARILQDGSGFEAYQFASEVPGADIPAMQSRVLAVGTAWEAYYFARDVPKADMAACQARVLEVGSAGVIYTFAKVPGVDISALQTRLLSVEPDLDRYKAAYWFAKNVPKADIQALQACVLAEGDCDHFYQFARDITSADVEALHAAAQAQGFVGLTDNQRTRFGQLLAEYRALNALADEWQAQSEQPGAPAA